MHLAFESKDKLVGLFTCVRRTRNSRRGNREGRYFVIYGSRIIAVDSRTVDYSWGTEATSSDRKLFSGMTFAHATGFSLERHIAVFGFPWRVFGHRNLMCIPRMERRNPEDWSYDVFKDISVKLVRCFHVRHRKSHRVRSDLKFWLKLAAVNKTNTTATTIHAATFSATVCEDSLVLVLVIFRSRNGTPENQPPRASITRTTQQTHNHHHNHNNNNKKIDIHSIPLYCILFILFHSTAQWRY